MKPVHLGLAIGLVVAFAVGYNNIYARQQGQARLKRAQILQEQANQKARLETAELINQLGAYRGQLPPEPDPSWLIQQVLPYAEQAGLTVASITQQSPQPFSGKQKSFIRLAVDLQFNATYHELGTFIDLLERSGRFIQVERLSVQSTLAEESRVPIQLTLSTLFISPLSYI